MSATRLAEYDSTAVEGDVRERWFVHGPGFPDPLVMVDLTSAGDAGAGTAEYLYYLKDMLGSVTALADDSGEVVERYVYDPYGRTSIVVVGFEREGMMLSGGSLSGFTLKPPPAVEVSRYLGRFGNPFAWTGQRYDKGVGLYHFLFRSYSPELGRWLQRDPLGYVDGASLQEYVGSSPCGRTDPHGLTWPKSFGGNPKSIEPNWHFQQQIVPRVKPKPRNLNPQLDPQYYVDPGWWNRFWMTPSLEWMDDDESFEEKQTEFYDWGSSGTPFVNDGRDMYGFWYGIDPVTGEPLETWEQGVYGFGFVFGSGPLYRKGLKKVGGWWDRFKKRWNKPKKPNGDWWKKGRSKIPKVIPGSKGHRPPGWNPNWDWGEASPRGRGKHWWDQDGGEWRWHAPDKYHSDGHWDYNPWEYWNDEWQNIPSPCD